MRQRLRQAGFVFFGRRRRRSRYPWVRLVSGIVAMVVLAAWLTWSGLTDPLWAPAVSLSETAWSATLAWSADAAARTGAPWIAAALLVALVSSRLSMRLAWPRA